MRLILLGPPGSGKGTMSRLLSEHYNVLHVSTGDLFRHHIRNNTELGKKVKGFVSSGGLVPDELTMQLLSERLNHEDAQEGFILDGFPRTINQANLLQEKFPVKKVVLLKVSDKTVLQRLSSRRTCGKCGMIFNVINIPPKKEGVCDVCQGELIQRDDEKEEVIFRRLKVYKEQTLPLVNHYNQQNLLIEVDAEPTPEIIFKSITRQIIDA